jgi:hypothetical protein
MFYIYHANGEVQVIKSLEYETNFFGCHAHAFQLHDEFPLNFRSRVHIGDTSFPQKVNVIGFMRTHLEAQLPCAKFVQV